MRIKPTKKGQELRKSLRSLVTFEEPEEEVKNTTKKDTKKDNSKDITSKRKSGENTLPPDEYKAELEPMFEPIRFWVKEIKSQKNQYLELSVKKLKNKPHVWVQMYQESESYTGYLKGKTIYLPLEMLHNFIENLEDLYTKVNIKIPKEEMCKEESKQKEENKADNKSKKTENAKSVKALELICSFPPVLEFEGRKFELASDIQTMEDLYKAFENESIICAFYWTKRHLRQFNYFNGDFEAPPEFQNDCDLATCMYISDEFKVAYAVSMYTEACYMIFPKDLEEDEDGIRYSGGVEFQIYRKKVQ